MKTSLRWLWIVLSLFVDWQGADRTGEIYKILSFLRRVYVGDICVSPPPEQLRGHGRFCTHQNIKVRNIEFIIDGARDIMSVYSDETYPYYFFTTVF